MQHSVCNRDAFRVRTKRGRHPNLERMSGSVPGRQSTGEYWRQVFDENGL